MGCIGVGYEGSFRPDIKGVLRCFLRVKCVFNVGRCCLGFGR